MAQQFMAQAEQDPESYFNLLPRELQLIALRFAASQMTPQQIALLPTGPSGFSQEAVNQAFTEAYIRQWLDYFKGVNDRVRAVLTQASLAISEGREFDRAKEFSFLDEAKTFYDSMFADMGTAWKQFPALAAEVEQFQQNYGADNFV
jgi:hypothetical protein